MTKQLSEDHLLIFSQYLAQQTGWHYSTGRWADLERGLSRWLNRGRAILHRYFVAQVTNLWG